MFFEVLFIILLLKLFVDVTKGKCHSKKRLDGKTVLITGGNSGIGKETVRDFAWRGAKIIMASRNISLSEKVKQEIINETANTNIIVKKLDISSKKSIRFFAYDIAKSVSKIDILIHNSGVFPSDEYSIDGIPKTMAANLFGPFLLTHLLIHLIKKSQQGRIIFVSSTLALFGKINFSDLKVDGSFENIMSLKYYGVSKYGITILSNLMARKLISDNISVNSLHPGTANTPMNNKICIIIKLMLLFGLCKTPEEGAQTQIHVAVDDAGEKYSGKFFIDCYPFNIFNGPANIKNAKILWKKAKILMDISDDDIKF